MAKEANPIAMANDLLYSVISAAVAVWALSELALTWILGLPQTPSISTETHLYINVGLFLLFTVLIWWKVNFQRLGIPTIGRLLSR